MQRFLLVMAALAAAICVFAGLTLPPRRLPLAPSADGTVSGILHIHTTRSDGRGTPDEVAAAASRPPPGAFRRRDGSGHPPNSSHSTRRPGAARGSRGGRLTRRGLLH